MKKGTSVTVRMPRGAERTGRYVGVVDSARGQFFVIKPHEKSAQTFKARPSCVTPA